MSKTDKTRPAWVQLWDETVPSVIVHDHIGGECIEENFEWVQFTKGHWKFSADWDMFFKKRPTCKRDFTTHSYCAMVAMYYGNPRCKKKYANIRERSARQKARGKLRNAIREYNANGSTDITPDPYFPRNSALWDVW